MSIVKDLEKKRGLNVEIEQSQENTNKREVWEFFVKNQ